MRKRVVITGMGWVTPLGHDIETAWRRLLAGESGIAATTIFDARTFPTSFAAEVKGYQLANDLPDSHAAHTTANRSTQFALGAARQAWKQAGLPLVGHRALKERGIDPYAIGIYLGSGEGAPTFEMYTLMALEAWNASANTLDTAVFGARSLGQADAIAELEQEPNMTIMHLSQEFDARGPAINCLTACAASTQAIGEATELIRRGDAEVIISGGAHSMIHPLGVTGFNRLTALSTFNENPRAACRPFDALRSGFVLGEGAGIVILESLDHAVGRGANIVAEIAGYGSSADAYRVTDQHPEGRGAVVAIREALRDAELNPRDIQYINAHGTGTKENDSTETLAIKKAFSEHAKHVPISSIKSMMGHLIAAAGAVEVIACALAIRDGMLPPTANYANPDPECDLDYIPNSPRKAHIDAALSNSFGFGGQNDTLIIKRFVL